MNPVNAVLSAAIYFLSFATATDALAAPEIQSLSGPLSADSSFTIHGAGFGASGPAVVIFDDFNKGALGAKIPLTDPAIGAWSANNINQPTYEPGFGTGYGMRTFTTNVGMQQFKSRFERTSEILVSFRVRLPNAIFPNTLTERTFPASSSWKLAWVMNGDDGYRGMDDLCLPSFIDGNNFAVTGNGPRFILYSGTKDPASWFSFDHWMRILVYLKGGAPDPTVDNGIAWFQAVNSIAQKTFSSTNQPVMGGTFSTAPHGWTQVNFPGWLAGAVSQPTAPVYDDIYVATGAHAQARVEVGNAQTYSSSTRLSLATITSWSDTAVTATFRQGDFAPGETVYVYIIDGTGAMNANGYPIRLAPALRPSAPASLRSS